VHRWRRNHAVLDFSRLLLFLGILIEKSFGTIIPGFVPDPWGKVHEYEPPSASRSATSDNSFGRSSRLPETAVVLANPEVADKVRVASLLSIPLFASVGGAGVGILCFLSPAHGASA